MAIKFQIVNGREINKLLNNKMLRYYDRLKKEIYRAATNTQGGAKRKCPVDTGRLRSSINVHIFDGGFSATVNAETNYAYYVEYGTGKYAHFKNGRTTQWMFYTKKYGWRWTSGQKPKLFMTKTWDIEGPKFMSKVKALKVK